ncbi:hypothetical protein MGG_16197 [Pyricularia oryzae 70-15]|uniref:Uncharacterized protein n=1 Tax=Pyricularia oryzae (strain 70-15 / ATCC MYA-4617 / FGSC 8958) TaxID=242507 RepID=G4MMK5_PYRO7|nr:uncharacterized protein MGG_16197 [Pyricularia oryzae 70-15]EHA56983.1 hypothetical protein MGG_16197 [Pyricularia oryzae 70-15]
MTSDFASHSACIRKKSDKIRAKAMMQGATANYQTSAYLPGDLERDGPPLSPVVDRPNSQNLGTNLGKTGNAKRVTQPGKCQAPLFVPFQQQQPEEKGWRRGAVTCSSSPSGSPVVWGFQRAKKKSIEQKMVNRSTWGWLEWNILLNGWF